MTYSSLREKIAAESAERQARYQQYETVWDAAVEAGNRAAVAAIPAPMVVQQHDSPLDDGSPVVRQWVVDDGPCGFAEVRLPKGNTSFAHWAKKNAGFRKHYYGGLSFWVSDFGQSMERKYAFARAAASILNEHGIDAYASSRLD